MTPVLDRALPRIPQTTWGGDISEQEGLPHLHNHFAYFGLRVP